MIVIEIIMAMIANKYRQFCHNLTDNMDFFSLFCFLYTFRYSLRYGTSTFHFPSH